MPDTPTLKKQLPRFLIAGCTAVATDFLSYTILLSIFDHTLAKALSFVFGTIVAYLFNKYWTFERPHYNYSEVLRFVFLYTCTLGANVAVNYAMLLLFPELVFFAFLSATGVSTILNFVGQKWWVFKLS